MQRVRMGVRQARTENRFSFTPASLAGRKYWPLSAPPLGFDCEFATPTPAILLNGTLIRCCTKAVCCNVATVCRPAAPIVGFVKISLSFKDATSSRKSTRRTTPLSLGGF